MPYRDRAQEEGWLSDFWDEHSLFDDRLTVLDDDFVPHANSGLVVAHLSRSPGIAYLSVKTIGDEPRWMVTFEPRQEAIDLDASGVHELAREIGALGILCDYLQGRTDQAIRAVTR
jgi:hypothetical protein